MDSVPVVTLRGVGKAYGGRAVLSEVSLNIGRGEGVVLRGGNGSGKSTLLRIVAGIIPFHPGQRLLRHPNIRIGYAPDRLPGLRMTSTQYLTHMGRISNMPDKPLRERIKELHTLLGLEPHQRLHMIRFSKGMLQKVNLMQATLLVPDLLVLDEPFAGLDQETTERLAAYLNHMRTKGTAILAAAHDLAPDARWASRAWRIRRGKLEEEGAAGSRGPSGVCFELECSLSRDALRRLAVRFPDMSWTTDGAGMSRCTVMQKDYRDVLLELIDEGIEIASLRRRERDS